MCRCMLPHALSPLCRLLEGTALANLMDVLEALTQGLACRTSEPLIWANRAAAALRLQRPAEALQDARTSRQLDPAYVKVGSSSNCSVSA